jgi:hypothetical protein
MAVGFEAWVFFPGTFFSDYMLIRTPELSTLLCPSFVGWLLTSRMYGLN